MRPNDKLPKAIAVVCFAAIAVGLLEGLAAWGFSQLDSTEQALIAASGMANGWLFTNTTQTGDDHVDP